MELRRVRTFVTVAELGSVSKAAQRLHISQPGLSRQLQELQHELGLRLFHRIGRRLVLTAEGEQLLGSCRDLLAHATSIGEQAQLLRDGESGSLRVAASPIQIETALATFLPAYAERYPKVRVALMEAGGTTTLAMLERGDIHVGIALIDAAQAEERQFGIRPARPLELLAACRPSFPLRRGNAISIPEIASHPVLVPDISFTARNTFDAICRLAGIKPNILMESRAHHTTLALAEAGLGVAIISTTVRTDPYRLRIVGITHDGKPIREPLAVVWDKRRALPRYAQDFCRSLAAHMDTLFPLRRSPGRRAPPPPTRGRPD